MAFTNYLDMLPNLTIPSLIKNRTTYEQPLPINLTFPVFDSSLKDAPTNLKSFMCKYAKHKEIFDFKQILHKIKEVEANPNSEETNSGCRTLA